MSMRIYESATRQRNVDRQLKQEKMAKKITTPKAETAEVVEEVKVKALVVPEVPKVASLFLVGDQQINKQLLEKRIKETKDLKIDGLKDTAGYKAVNTALAEFRTTRTTLEKVRKANVEPIQDFLKDYKAQTDELKAICQGQETILAEKLKTIDDEKDRIKKEKELEKLRIMQARIQSLLAVGAVSDPENGTYAFPFALQFFTNDVQLSEMEDEEYNELLADVTECYNTEQARIAQEKADKEAEDERIRLQGIAQAEEAKRLNERRTKLREKELRIMGFDMTDPNAITLGGTPIKVGREEIENGTDVVWDAFIVTVEALIDEMNQPQPEQIPVVIGESTTEAIVNRASGTTSALQEDSDVLVGEETAIDLIGQNVIEPDAASQYQLDFTEELYEDLHVAQKFFVRVYPVADQANILDGIHPDRVISSGLFKNRELGWSLIKLMP